MRVSESIRYLARDIIKGYVKHIQKKIALNDPLYILSGVDKDYDTYEDLFEVVMGFLFKKSDNLNNFNEDLVQECVGVMDLVIEDSKCSRAMKYADGVYDTCILLYKRIENGVIESGRN